VVQENGTDVVVFDASGKPRTFHGTQLLCFQTHGNDTAGDLLTPCFDENGNHGDPEEDCFCGIDTPHLHAHVYDPRGCHDDENYTGDKMSLLASHILHPVTDENELLIQIGVSESMPKECNARAWQRNNDYHPGRRVHEVQHDDHVDYLVHNQTTGQLHLEHPCDDCGQNDIHGAFRNVGERRLKLAAGNHAMHFFQVSSKPFTLLDYIHSAFDIHSDRVAAATLDYGTIERLPSRPMQESVSSTLSCGGICCASESPIIEKRLAVLAGVEKVMINVPLKQVIVKHNPQLISAKELERVLNEEHMKATIMRDGAPSFGKRSSAGRSQFFVQHICCASEIPAIRKIVEPLPGVTAVSINTTTKAIYVDHETTIISAQDICDALNREKFGAEIRYDAATSNSTSLMNFVQSTLSLDDPADRPEAETLRRELLGEFHNSHIESIVVDVSNRNITVVHNPFLVSAETVATFLRDKANLHVSVSVDGSDPSRWSLPVVEVTDAEEVPRGEEVPKYPKASVVMSGVFWIISMLHYIGENW
jgi:copper chaperone CopZ